MDDKDKLRAQAFASRAAPESLQDEKSRGTVTTWPAKGPSFRGSISSCSRASTTRSPSSFDKQKNSGPLSAIKVCRQGRLPEAR